ncbi:MAG: SoxR reducing system RseC family protein [Christensenellales bacterium]
MQRIGRVVGAEKGGVRVSIQRIAACRGCGACGRDIKSEVLLANGKADTGDVVRLELLDGHSKKTFPITYPLHALCFLAGVIIASRLLGGAELGLVLGGAAGLVLSAILLKLWALRQEAATDYQARVISVNDPEAIRQINEEGICPKAAAWSSPKTDG